MLPEVRDILLSPFVGYAQFELHPDTTKQHVIMSIIHNYSGFEDLSDEGLEEIYNIRIVQGPIQLDGDEKDHMRVSLIVANRIVATVVTRLYDDLPAISLMMNMRSGLLRNQVSYYTQNILLPSSSDDDWFLLVDKDGVHIFPRKTLDKE